MKTLVLILLLALTAVAQQPKPTPPPAPSSAQQSALKDATTAYTKALAEAETAKQHFLAVLYSVMAELGLKPSEYTFNQNPQTGEISFQHVEKAAEVIPLPKKDTKP